MSKRFGKEEKIGKVSEKFDIFVFMERLAEFRADQMQKDQASSTVHNE